MSNSEYKYEVRGYRTLGDVNGFGSSCEIGCDTLKEAKAKAKFIITDDEMRLVEASRPLGYSQVVNRFTGEVVADYFNNKICQSCGQDFPKTAKERLEHVCHPGDAEPYDVEAK